MNTTAQIKSIVDRILRLKAEQDDLAADIRDIYAEAKGNGFDKTALGQVVAAIRKRDKVGALTLSERDAIFEIYMAEYEGGTRVATRTHAHEAKSSDGGPDGRALTPEVARVTPNQDRPSPPPAPSQQDRDAKPVKPGPSDSIDEGIPSFLKRDANNQVVRA